MYDRLVECPGNGVIVSGGLRTPTDDGYQYDASALYEPLGVPTQHIRTVDEIKRETFDLLIAANTRMIRPQRIGSTVQIFHGISFRNRSVRAANMSADFYFIAGPYQKRCFVNAGLTTDDDPRLLNIGFMKTDRLVDGSLDRAELLARHGFDGSRPVILYAPTGQKHNSLETMGEEAIAILAEAARYDLIIKPHDHPKNRTIDWFERLERFESRHVRLSRASDVIPLLFMADLLITDASSVSSEYMLLDRPIVFLDVPKLLRHASRKSGSRVDLETWGRRTGVVAGTPDDCAGAVAESLAQPENYSETRRAAAADLFYNPGCATEAAVRWISQSHGGRDTDRLARPAVMPLPVGRQSLNN